MNDLTSGVVWKKLLRFAIPIFSASLLQAMYGTIDLMVVGHFADSEAVSGVSTGSMTMQTLTGVVFGLTTGVTVLLGQNIGKKDNKAGARTIAAALSLFILFAIGLTVIVTLLAGPLARVMNAPEPAYEDTVSYIRICGGGIFCIVLYNAISGVFRGMGDSKTPLILVGIACLINIVGDLLFVGVFHLGTAGAAIATVIAQGVSALCAYFLLQNKNPDPEESRLRPRLYGHEIKKILFYGVPVAMQELLTGVSFMVILAILNDFGLTASAGVGIAERLAGIFFIIPGSMLAALSAFSAQNVGAGRRDRALRAMLVSMGITCSAGLVVFLASFWHGAALASLFSKVPEDCAAAGDYLRSYSIDCVIVGINFSIMGYLNGNGKTGFVGLQGILSAFLVRIPVSYVMSKIEGVTLFQIGFATPMATVFAIVLTVSYLAYFEWKMIKIES